MYSLRQWRNDTSVRFSFKPPRASRDIICFENRFELGTINTPKIELNGFFKARRWDARLVPPISPFFQTNSRIFGAGAPDLIHFWPIPLWILGEIQAETIGSALRASRILASKKPISSLMVPSAGIEPASHPPQGCIPSVERHEGGNCTNNLQ